MKYQNICSAFLAISILNVPFNALAETQTCRDNAAMIVEQMQASGEYPNMTNREVNIAKRAAIAACDETFAKLETDLKSAKNAPKTEEGVDPSQDPLGWLKEQWSKEPIKKKGLERLERRRR